MAPKTHALAISTDGFALRCSIEPFAEPSTRSGRRYARPSKNAEIIGVAKVDGSETIIAATKAARAILCHAKQVKMLSGPGKGVTLIKLPRDQENGDEVLGFIASRGPRELLTVETSRGATQTISTGKYEVSGRGGRGRRLLQRGQFTRVVPRSVIVPSLGTDN